MKTNKSKDHLDELSNLEKGERKTASELVNSFFLMWVLLSLIVSPLFELFSRIIRGNLIHKKPFFLNFNCLNKNININIIIKISTVYECGI